MMTLIRPFRRCVFVYATACLLSASAALSAQAIGITWSEVGNAGNAGDASNGGVGSVGYTYYISTYEVTNAQYAAFLNAVDPSAGNTLALYSNGMAGADGGIQLQAGNAPGSKFVLIPGRENNPVTYVSWFDAARFTNWLHNGQGSGSTESGAYTLLGGTPTPSLNANIVRAPGAQYFLPNRNEWHKAAYHNAAAGTAGVYFDFATASDTAPVSDKPADNPAAVNYYNNDGLANGFNDGYALSGTNSEGDPISQVGAYPDAESPYGTFDQNGNLSEWIEEKYGANLRGSQGGSWEGNISSLNAAFTGISDPGVNANNQGFRVATLVPEPGSLLLLAAAAPALLRRRRRGA